MQDLIFESSAYPVLRIEEDEKVRVVATCTLVRTHNDHHFLINASHTLNQDSWGNNLPIFIAFPDNTLELSQNYPFGGTVKTNLANSDYLDVSVTSIDPSFIIRYNLSSLPLYDDFPHERFSHLSQRIVYFGYPYSRSNIDIKQGGIKSDPILYTSTETTSLREDLKNRHTLSLEHNILSTYSRRKILTQEKIQQMGPKPQGLSGGPVFRAYVSEQDQIDDLHIMNFIGISTDYIDNLSLLKATRKESLLDFIKGAFRI